MTTLDTPTSLGAAGYDNAALQQKAKDHLWMHFARQSTMETSGVPIITRGEGHHIFDVEGRKYFDGLSGLFVVNAGHGRARLAAAGGEEDAVQVAGRACGEPLGELDRARVRVRPEREERELLGLLRGCLSQLLAAVPDLDDEQPGEAVDVLVAAVVPDLVAVAAGDDRNAVAQAALAAVLEDRVAREVHPQVVASGLAVQRAERRVRVAGRFEDGQVSGHRVPQL